MVEICKHFCKHCCRFGVLFTGLSSLGNRTPPLNTEDNSSQELLKLEVFLM
jgi:hypothetical protein